MTATLALNNRMTVPTIAKILAMVALAAVLAGCAITPPPSKSAPCKRPATLSAYAPIVPHDCGPMHAINSAETAAALLAL